MKIKKLFLVIPFLLFLVGCEYLPVEYSPVKTPDKPLVTETNEVDGRIVFDYNTEADEVLVDGRLALRVAFATDELLSEYDSYVEFIGDEVGNKYLFLPFITLRDFQWIKINHKSVEGMSGFQFYQQSVLYPAGDLPSGVPFVVTTMNDDMPLRGISFLDANGARRYFAITLNQAEPEERPGTFIIFEFDNR